MSTLPSSPVTVSFTFILGYSFPGTMTCVKVKSIILEFDVLISYSANDVTTCQISS